jgi:hypothetical protein
MFFPCFFIKCLLYLPLVDAAFHKLESGCEINKTVGIIALVAFKGVIFETNYSLCLYFNPFSKPFSAAVYA